MPTEDQGSSTGSRLTSTGGAPWFGPNRSGVGYRPQTWQDWVTLGACLATLTVIVVVLRTGLL